MRRIAYAALALLLATAQAVAQVPYFPQSLPAGTVVGRLPNSAGPTEAIPFANLSNVLGLPGINVKNAPYSAVGNGISDDTAAINSAIAACVALSGCEVKFPPGNYLVSSPIAITSSAVQIRGSGRNNTTVFTISPTLDVFQFKGTTFDSSIGSLTVSSTAVTPTAGAGIATSNGVGDVRILDVRVQNTFNGISVINAPITGVVELNNVDVSTVFNDAIYVNGVSQFFADNVTTFQNSTRRGGAGVHIQSAGGFYLSNVTPGGNNTGLLIDPPTGNLVQDGFVTNFEADSNSFAGVSIDTTNGGTVYNLVIENSRAGFCAAGPGFAFNGANTSNISLSNFTALKNFAEGVQILNLKDSVIRGGQVEGNAATGGTNSGIHVNAGDGLIITHNRVGAYPGTGNNQPYGLLIEAAFTGNLIATDNDFRGNVTSGINNLSSSSNIILLNNNYSGAPTFKSLAAGYVSSVGLKTASSTDGVGYTTGAGGTVTQLTSKSTAVTLNRASGQITMNNAALASGAAVAFTLNNSVYNNLTDVVHAHHASGGSSLSYRVDIQSGGAGAINFIVTNTTGGSLSEAIVINFIIIKGSSN